MLGISQGTVDRALHNRGGVSRETALLVQKATTELNYKTNRIAQLLKTGKTLTVAFITPQDNLFERIKKGVESFQSDLVHDFLKVDWYGTAGFDSAAEIDVIRRVLDGTADAIAIAPADPQRLTPWINTAMSRNVPVVTINTDAPESVRLCYVGLEHYRAGRIAGELMGKFMRGKGKVHYIAGYLDAYSQRERMHGFETAIRESFPGIAIVGKYRNDHNTADEAYETTRGILAEGSTEDSGYMVASGNGSSGVVRALRELEVRHHMPMVCFDFLPDNIRLLKSGDVSAILGEDPFSQGFQTVKCLYDYCFSKEQAPVSIFTNVSVGLRENIDMLLKAEDGLP